VLNSEYRLVICLIFDEEALIQKKTLSIDSAFVLCELKWNVLIERNKMPENLI
jgi:hypothetical protein